ncbi:serine/threonine protein kinase [Stieleria varia]|uniref:Serine/threonine-protein kinase PknB n=1 Tax=Stieleria varia TaxID=2528005 RepID=A0A5C6AXI4_9BACT|nr:serine/threonine protein kinase [Stieleria varia]TWU04338.1 Serine/threonine-protein kinase PknB [Stieleria varia]
MSNEDLTQQQSPVAQSASQKLSMQATTPPAEVPGYRLERFLGSGAFGQVWTGRDLNTGRPIAVKFFLHRGGVNWSLLSHEVKSLVQLSADRHVVQVLEVGWESDPPYYVMELVTGGSLEEMLSHREQLPIAEAVELFHKICVGLNHCHSKGVLHCDLKPANVLLDDDNEPRLADFGQSRMTHDQTPALGTLFYMAPEQADLESTPDSSWDVYAAGAILYRMLTGKPPYRDEKVVDQLDTAGSLPKRLARYRQAIQESSPPSEQLKQTGVDRTLTRIISRCLAFEPTNRYANVQEILQDLDERERARSRRPLMVLGLIGPLILLAAASWFASRTVAYAGDKTRQALRDEAYGSNLLTARFAARTLEGELERYFRMCKTESSRGDFIQTLRHLLDDPQATQMREKLVAAGTPEKAYELTDVRETLLDVPARQAMEDFLQQRLQRYVDIPAGVRRPELDSMFVTDKNGTILSIAYANPVTREKSSAGRNFAYRTYFHALPNDLPKDTPIESVEPLKYTHLSSAFSSDATGIWKVAVSLPIYIGENGELIKADDEEVDEDAEPDAVFVVTTNLGKFDLLQGGEGANLIAALVEARQGPLRGTILQHPYLEERLATGIEHKGQVYRVQHKTMDKLVAGGDIDYVDPVSSGDDSENYAGNWLVAMEPVALPAADDLGTERRPGDSKASLMVLVQYRLAKVFAPVGAMQSELLWEGATAVLSVLLIILFLWYFVRRTGKQRAVPQQTAATTRSTGLTETLQTKV